MDKNNKASYKVKEEKIKKYVDLMMNNKMLINSSKSIIRRKRSAIARKINNGNIKAAIKVSIDKIYGSLSKETRNELCQLVCQAKNELKNSINQQRDIFCVLLGTVIAKLEIVGSALIAILWIFREKLYEAICKCKLNRDCLTGNCN